MEAWDLMNFSQLSSNEKMAVYASVVVVVTGIVSLVNKWGGLIILPLLAAVVMLLVLFAPSIMPNAKLPGSKGSLMLVAGGVAAAFWLISALTWFDWIFGHLGRFDTIQYLVGLAGSLVMGWTGWQAFQAEGGKFQMGMGGAASVPPVPMVPPPAASPAAPPSSMPPSDAGPNGDDDQP
jgi:hypothetical protein